MGTVFNRNKPYVPLTDSQLKGYALKQMGRGDPSTRDQVISKIVRVEFNNVLGVTGELRLIRCTMELDNGFITEVNSAVVDPNNFYQSVGHHIAYNRAVDRMTDLYAFALMELHHREKQAVRPAGVA